MDSKDDLEVRSLVKKQVPKFKTIKELISRTKAPTVLEHSTELTLSHRTCLLNIASPSGTVFLIKLLRLSGIKIMQI